MGVPGRIIVVNKKPAAFTMNYLYGDRRVDNRKVMEMFPAYEQCCFMGFGFEREVPKGWNHIDLGAGNSLFVADEVYEEFKRLTADFTEDYELYGAWQDAACRIVGLPDKDDTESE